MKVKLLGSSSKKFVEEQVKIIATAAKLSRFPGTVTEVFEKCNDYESNLKFIKRVISLGHESIIDHDYLVFSIENVSPIIEQIIINERLSSFTIKSRREVNFSKAGFYVPKFKYKNGISIKKQKYFREKYISHMNFVFEQYGQLIETGVSKEDARFALPYCYHSNIIMGIDAHIVKNLIIKFTTGKYSRMDEIKEFGEKLKRIVEKRAPYLIPLIEKETYRTDCDELFEKLNFKKQYNIIDKVRLLSCTNDVDNTIITTYLMQKYQYSLEEAEKVYFSLIKKDESLKSQIMQAILKQSNKNVLTSVNFRFQIPISFAILTQLTRHRTHDLLVPDFAPVGNLEYYKIPPSIQESDKLEKFKNIFNKNIEMYNEFKNYGIRDEDLMYFYLSGNMVNVVTNMNGKTLEWILHLRECNKSQWEIRKLAHQMHDLVKEKAPYFSQILGPTCKTLGICKEGKESCGLIDILITQ